MSKARKGGVLAFVQELTRLDNEDPFCQDSELVTRPVFGRQQPAVIFFQQHPEVTEALIRSNLSVSYRE